MHQGLDDKADGISGGLNNLHCTLVRAVSQVHTVHLNYSISNLKACTYAGGQIKFARAQPTCRNRLFNLSVRSYTSPE